MNRTSEARGARFPVATAFAVFATLSACAPDDTRGAPAGMGGEMPAGAPGTGGMTTSSSGGTSSSSGGTSSSSGGAGSDDPSGTCKTVTSLAPCGTNPNPCGIHSGYPGDEYCMPPPPEGKGMQMHFGPKDYTDPTEVARYVLKPGKEVSDYWVVKLPNTEDRWFLHTKIQMRPGSHHLVNNIVSGDVTEGFTSTPGCPGDMEQGFPGAQTLVTDAPPGGVPAPENVGLGSKLPANTHLCVNQHGYNFTEQAQLREVWMNIWFIDKKDVTLEAKGVFLSAGPYMGIAPMTSLVLPYTATVPGDGRILSLLGHRHAYTERFAVFKNEELVYDSWSWQESAVFTYDSITRNPPINPAAKTDGALSGDLYVKQGDKLRIECHVNNTSNNTLTFKNQLYGGEMCLLFGGAVGTEIISAF